MPTSVHIPPRLLEALDRRAKALGVSRNRVIVSALEHELARTTSWSPGFFEKLTPVDPRDAEAVDEMMKTIRHSRTRKGPPSL